MYFAVMKIAFDEEGRAATAGGGRELKALAEKIRSRFKVSAAASPGEETGGGDAIAVAALGSTEEKLSKTLDAIVSFCEQAGFGRIAGEDTLFDHVDAIAEYGDGP
jgi:uncharacterized protein YlxP (DUF503 family)